MSRVNGKEVGVRFQEARGFIGLDKEIEFRNSCKPRCLGVNKEIAAVKIVWGNPQISGPVGRSGKFTYSLWT